MLQFYVGAVFSECWEVVNAMVADKQGQVQDLNFL